MQHAADTPRHWLEGTRVTPRSVCIDFESGIQLHVYPGRMTQVQQGHDFYIGQVPYVVVEVVAGGDDDDLLIVLRRKQAT